jgi:hypothetical protein
MSDLKMPWKNAMKQTVGTWNDGAIWIVHVSVLQISSTRILRARDLLGAVLLGVSL